MKVGELCSCTEGKQYSFNIWMFSSLRRRSGEQEVMDCPGDKGYYWPHIHCQHPLMQIYAAETPAPESELTREAPEEAPPTRHRALPGGLSILTRLIPHCWGKTGLDWAVITTYTELNSFLLEHTGQWPSVIAGWCWGIKCQIRSVISASPPLELVADAEVSFIMKSACFAYL